jgi:3-hydroxyisobutyrate dehydrogenase
MTQSPSFPLDEEIGFIGLGVMGQPMALRLAKAGARLVVWNRTPERCEPLHALGAAVAADVNEVFARTRVVFVMLANESVTDAVLGRDQPAFAQRVRDHLLVSMGSNAPDYSRALAADLRRHGAHYVEAPVSGSRTPAEQGALVALLGGEPDDLEHVRPLLAPMCRATVLCGSVGEALLMKLAVNLYLDTTLVALAEAVHFADRNGLDLDAFQTAIESGALASDLTRVKIPKLIARDFAVQAAITDVHYNTRLIADAARAVGLASPLLDLSSELYAESLALGNARLDMTAVLEAIEARTEATATARTSPPQTSPS